MTIQLRKGVDDALIKAIKAIPMGHRNHVLKKALSASLLGEYVAGFSRAVGYSAEEDIAPPTEYAPLLESFADDDAPRAVRLRHVDVPQSAPVVDDEADLDSAAGKFLDMFG